jgi:ubiquinone/menaquinone biosynthesis C-methylase UbiE
MRKLRDLFHPNDARSRAFWSDRNAGNPEHVETWWNHRLHPSRQIPVETVASLPVQSVLEVGAAVGANLYELGRRRRFDMLAGTDLNLSMVEEARRRLAHLPDQPSRVEVADLSALPFPDKSFDATLCLVVLCCVGPRDIKRALREVLRVTRRYVVIADTYEESETASRMGGREDPYPNTMYWVRNYPRLLQSVAPGCNCTLRVLAEGERHGHVWAITVAELMAGRR